MRALWALYSLAIVYATTLPFRFERDWAWAVEKAARVPLDVLASPDGGMASVPDMVQNVLLFAPFGVLGALALARGTPPRVNLVPRGAPRPMAGLWRRAGVVSILGAALSMAVETLQLFTSDRVTSLNDVITNTSGAAFGALIAGVVPGILSSGGPAVAVRLSGSTRACARPALAALALVATASWHPFDPSLDLGTLAAKARNLLAEPWQMGTIGDEAVDLLRYALLGGAVAAWSTCKGFRRPRAVAAIGAVSAAAAFELSQMFVGSRMPGLADMSVAAAGGLVGAILGPGAATSPPRTAALVAATGWLAAAWMVLAPFEVASTRQQIEWVPFLGYYQYTSRQTVSHVVELALAFFPIGYAAASVWKPHSRQVAPRSRHVAFIVTMLVMAGTLEYLQSWIAGRYADVTDVVVMTLGGLAGWHVGRAPNPNPEP
jgi:VanZ family protein